MTDPSKDTERLKELKRHDEYYAGGGGWGGVLQQNRHAQACSGLG